MKEIYLRVHHGKNVSFIGSWSPANEMMDNFEQQKDIGWHIFLSLQDGADKVEAVLGDQQKDYDNYRKMTA